MNIHEAVRNLFPQFEVLDIENWPYTWSAAVLRPKNELLQGWAFLIRTEEDSYHSGMRLYDNDNKRAFYYGLICGCCLTSTQFVSGTLQAKELLEQFEVAKHAVLAVCHKSRITNLVTNGSGWFSSEDGSVKSVHGSVLRRVVEVIKEDHGLKALHNAFHGFSVMHSEGEVP